MLHMKFGMVGSALLPTCTYASTVRSSYLTSILGNSMCTLQEWISDTKKPHIVQNQGKISMLQSMGDTNYLIQSE